MVFMADAASVVCINSYARQSRELYVGLDYAIS